MADWIKNQLMRFRVQETEQTTVRDTIIETVFKYSGVKVELGSVLWRGRAVYLKVKPMEKSEILMKQKIILQKLEEILGRKAPQRLL